MRHAFFPVPQIRIILNVAPSIHADRACEAGCPAPVETGSHTEADKSTSFREGGSFTSF
jgi:hypothetical protein